MICSYDWPLKEKNRRRVRRMITMMIMTTPSLQKTYLSVHFTATVLSIRLLSDAEASVQEIHWLIQKIAFQQSINYCTIDPTYIAKYVTGRMSS